MLHGAGHLSIRSSGNGRKLEDGDQNIGWEGKFMTRYAEKDAEGNVKNPLHFPWIETGTDAIIAAEIILDRGYVPIVCKGISLEMNQMAGAIKAVKGRYPNIYDFLVEAALPSQNNPIGVRSVTHGGKIDPVVAGITASVLAARPDSMWHRAASRSAAPEKRP